MVNSTKEQILTYVREATEEFDFTIASQFTASFISEQLHISRSLASQYLNELVKEKYIIKINSRPVYFFHRKKMEEIYQIPFQDDDFYDLEELKQYVMNHSKIDSHYSKLIGSDQSLSSIIKQVREGFEYPNCGLPMIIYGEKGTSKRTLCTTIFENAARKGIIQSDTKLYKLELTSLNSTMICQKIFGKKDSPGLIEKYNHLVLMICGSQYMNDDLQEKLSHLIETIRNQKIAKNNSKIIRFMLLSETNPSIIFQDRLLKNIPIIIEMPSLIDKGQEEIEELVIHFVKNEGKVMKKNIKISNAVLRALVNGTYDNNMLGLRSAIQMMRASALRENPSNEEIIVHTYNLPDYLIRTMPITLDEDLMYIDTSIYQRSEEIDFILDYYDRILKPFSKNDMADALKDSKHYFDLLNDYLSFKQRIPPERIQGIETSLNNIVDILIKKRFINLPSGFCCSVAKLIYMNDLYSSSIEKWQKKNRRMIDEVINKMRDSLCNEVTIAEEIIRLMNANLEIQVNDILLIMMIVYLHHYNAEISRRKILGLIVCHGYSTATSIAEAVNTLLGHYIFEAIDMPLDISVDQIKDNIVEKLNRMHHSDVIVMVDMGSLEQLGNSLSQAVNCNVGVINNVSTRSALHAGEYILNEKDIETTLKAVSEDSKANYTIINRKKNDVILFASESGLHMAQRMRELFESSFPPSIPVDLEVCDFNQLVTKGQSFERFSYNNILFITGTANPHIEGQIFVALEEIISGNNIDIIMQRLSKYLSSHELDMLLDELRRNFTLQNVVGYLTILNPKILLDNVSLAVDNLQDCLNKRFSGKTLIGIYIHVCCLIERLVTKSAITEFMNLDQFEIEHESFIQNVLSAFSDITKRYNVTIPTSEIAYLYDFIAADEIEGKGNRNEE